MKSERWIIGVVARCQDCGEKFEDYITAREEAREHARRHKHLVMGEIVWYFKHDGRKDKK